MNGYPAVIAFDPEIRMFRGNSWDATAVPIGMPRRSMAGVARGRFLSRCSLPHAPRRVSSRASTAPGNSLYGLTRLRTPPPSSPPPLTARV